MRPSQQAKGERFRQLHEGAPFVIPTFNVLARPDLSVREIADAGGQRISVGGRLTRVAVGAMAEAARRVRDQGDLSVLEPAVPAKDIAGWLAQGGA
jgi:2-methylisocitrate lyase-like PEP mutase family enzyme